MDVEVEGKGDGQMNVSEDKVKYLAERLVSEVEHVEGRKDARHTSGVCPCAQRPQVNKGDGGAFLSDLDFLTKPW